MSAPTHVSHGDVTRSLRCAGMVERYHTWPIRKPTIADSTWHVMRIYWQVFGSPPAAVWEYVHFHDVAELGTGDTPFFAKRKFPDIKVALDNAEPVVLASMGVELPTLTDVEWRRFKACDLLEMHEFAKTEMMMGNALAMPVIANVTNALEHMREALGVDDFKLVCQHMERKLP